jgi:hypothetical protein
VKVPNGKVVAQTRENIEAQDRKMVAATRNTAVDVARIVSSWAGQDSYLSALIFFGATFSISAKAFPIEAEFFLHLSLRVNKPVGIHFRNINLTAAATQSALRSGKALVDPRSSRNPSLRLSL